MLNHDGNCSGCRVSESAIEWVTRWVISYQVEDVFLGVAVIGPILIAIGKRGVAYMMTSK